VNRLNGSSNKNGALFSADMHSSKYNWNDETHPELKATLKAKLNLKTK
jgi:hypothetical protein